MLLKKSECWLNFYLLLTECECWMLRSRLCYWLHWHVVHQFPQEFYMNCWHGLSHKTCIVTNLKSMEKIDKWTKCWLNVDLILRSEWLYLLLWPLPARVLHQLLERALTKDILSHKSVHLKILQIWRKVTNQGPGCNICSSFKRDIKSTIICIGKRLTNLSKGY